MGKLFTRKSGAVARPLGRAPLREAYAPKQSGYCPIQVMATCCSNDGLGSGLDLHGKRENRMKVFTRSRKYFRVYFQIQTPTMVNLGQHE